MPSVYLFQLSDSTDTVNLAESEIAKNFYVKAGGWSPEIAIRRPGVLGGQGPYGEVVEEVTFDTYGATRRELLRNLERVLALIERAKAWQKGEHSNPVYLTVRLDEGLPEMRQLVTGYEDVPIDLDVRFLDDLDRYTIQDVTIRIRRRGLWQLSKYPYAPDDNFVANSDNWTGTGSSWSGLPSGLVAGSFGTPLPRGGVGYFSIAIPAGQTLAAIRTDPYIPIIAGQPYVVTFAGEAPGGTILVRLDDAGGVPISNIATATPINLQSDRLQVTLTPTSSTSSGRLFFSRNGTPGQYLAISEVSCNYIGYPTDWHRKTSEETAWTAGSTHTQGTVATATFPPNTQRSISPYALAYDTVAGTLPAGLVCVANNPNRIALVDVVATTTPWSSVADSANLATGGSVARCQPTTTGDQTTPALSLPVGFVGKRVAVYALVRVNDTSRSWAIAATVSGGGIDNRTAMREVPSQTTPQVVPLGEAAVPFNVRTIKAHVQVTPVPLSAGPSIDIDALIVVGIDDPSAYTLTHGSINITQLTADPLAAVRWLVDAGIVVPQVEPWVGVVETSTSLPLLEADARGDAALHLSGNQLAALWITPDGSYWRLQSSGVAKALTLGAQRRPASLLPQT